MSSKLEDEISSLKQTASLAILSKLTWSLSQVEGHLKNAHVLGSSFCSSNAVSSRCCSVWSWNFDRNYWGAHGGFAPPGKFCRPPGKTCPILTWRLGTSQNQGAQRSSLFEFSQKKLESKKLHEFLKVAPLQGRPGYLVDYYTTENLWLQQLLKVLIFCWSSHISTTFFCFLWHL